MKIVCLHKGTNQKPEYNYWWETIFLIQLKEEKEKQVKKTERKKERKKERK